MTCDDLWLGGTLSSAGITGATNINGTNLWVADWSNLLGSWGISGGMEVVNGRPGGFVAGDLLPRERYPTLSMRIRPGLTDLAKQQATDSFLALIANPAGNYLEVDMPDGTSRFIYVYNFDPAPIQQPRKDRTVNVPLVSPNQYWREGGTESTDTISSGDTLVTGGNVNVYDAVLVFAGDGTFTHSGLGWAIEVTGSGGAVTVDMGNRTVTEGGNPALNRIRRTSAGDSRVWGWFTPGNNAVTSDVSVTVTWRDAWA